MVSYSNHNNPLSLSNNSSTSVSVSILSKNKRLNRYKPIITEILNPRLKEAISYTPRARYGKEIHHNYLRSPRTKDISSQSAGVKGHVVKKEIHLENLLKNTHHEIDSIEQESKSPSFFIEPENPFKKISEQLIKEEFCELSNLLNENHGPYWDKIKNLGTPVLMEQLVSLYKIFKINKDAVEIIDMNFIFDFCLRIAKGIRSPYEQIKIEDRNLLIGQLIYLVDLK